MVLVSVNVFQSRIIHFTSTAYTAKCIPTWALTISKAINTAAAAVVALQQISEDDTQKC